MHEHKNAPSSPPFHHENGHGSGGRHFTGSCVLVQYPVEGDSKAVYMHRDARRFAFTDESTERVRPPLLALKSFNADANCSYDKKETSVNICFGNESGLETEH